MKLTNPPEERPTTPDRDLSDVIEDHISSMRGLAAIMLAALRPADDLTHVTQLEQEWLDGGIDQVAERFDAIAGTIVDLAYSHFKGRKSPEAGKVGAR